MSTPHPPPYLLGLITITKIASKITATSTTINKTNMVWLSDHQCTFAFLMPEILELYTRNVCKMFVYKHTKTIEYVLFKKNTHFTGE